MKIDIVIMASGESKRFGQGNKLLKTIEGKPMYIYAFENAVKIREKLNCIGDIIVVSKYNEIKRDAYKYAFKYVENNNSFKGISQSLKLGIMNSNKDNSIMFMVCDQPYMLADTLIDFIKGYIASHKSIGCIACNNRLLNPCIFSPKWKENLMQITGDKGGKSVIKSNLNDVYKYKISNINEFRDIDRISHIYNFPFLNEKGHIISFVGAGGKTSLMFALAEILNNKGYKVLVTTTTHIYRTDEYTESVNEALKIWNKGKIVVAGTPCENNKLTMPDNIYEFIKYADTVLIEADGAKGFPLKVPAENEPVILDNCDTIIGVAGLDALGNKIKDVCFRTDEACKVLNTDKNHIITEEDMAEILTCEYGTMKYAGSREYYIVLNKCDNDKLYEKALNIKEMIKNKGFKEIHITCMEG